MDVGTSLNPAIDIGQVNTAPLLCVFNKRQTDASIIIADTWAQRSDHWLKEVSK